VQIDMDRFWPKVAGDSVTECWVWKGASGDGYGLVRVEGRRRLAHRLAYEHLVGEIPAGLQLDHVCHNADKSCNGGRSCPHRRCVNPWHLEPVTNRVNALRGRTGGGSGGRSKATHCKRGHEFDAANTCVHPDGRRSCRACEHLRHVARYVAVQKRDPSTCRHGHDLSEVGVYVSRRGVRLCRECRRNHKRSFNARARAAA
jgi:hypothetical protein